jgi:hypothetical protein
VGRLFLGRTPTLLAKKLFVKNGGSLNLYVTDSKVVLKDAAPASAFFVGGVRR